MGSRELELHSRLHAARADSDERRGSKVPGPASHPRLELFPLAEAALGREIRGDVIDLGAGNGYAGAWLAAHRDVRVTCLEVTPEAVEDLIPRTARALGVADRVQATLGSFEDLSGFAARFDFAVAFGALHHAPDLFRVLRGVAGCLVPGGVLILQEPCAPDATSNDTYRDLYEAPEVFAGERIRHGDRHDHFYRRCEYWTALHYCDFRVLHERGVARLLEGPPGRRALRRLLARLRRPGAAAADPAADFPRRRAEALRPTPWFAVCQRPERDRGDVPHRWGGLVSER